MIEEKVLIHRLNRGDNAVLHRVYEKYKHDLVSIAAALSNNNSIAEDAVHDVFVTLIKRPADFRFKGSLKAYLAACVVNNIRNRNKAATRRNAIQMDNAPQIATSQPPPDNAICYDELSSRISTAIAKLPIDQLQVVVLKAYTNLKFRQIAQIQNVSSNTVRGRYRYALEKLKTLLNGVLEK